MKKAVLLAFVLVLSSVSMLVVPIKQVEASGTIYIRTDGSIDPPTANITTVDQVTYTFTSSIYAEVGVESAIVVERDNIVVDGAGYTLQGSESTWSTWGIYLLGRSNVTIRNVEIERFFIGIEIDHSTKSSAQGNGIKNGGHGIWLSKSSNNTIRDNNIEGVMIGIWLHGSSNNHVSGNLVTTTFSGIDLSISSSLNKIFENTVKSSGHACMSISDSSGNAIYRNDLVDGLYISNSTNIWDDGKGGGNYWSRYYGADQDGDGIGDTPLVIDENNQDNYPLMNPVNPQILEIPFWLQWWFWTIIIVVIVALVGAIFLLKRGKPPIPIVPPLPSEGIT